MEKSFWICIDFQLHFGHVCCVLGMKYYLHKHSLPCVVIVCLGAYEKWGLALCDVLA